MAGNVLHYTDVSAFSTVIETWLANVRFFLHSNLRLLSELCGGTQWWKNLACALNVAGTFLYTVSQKNSVPHYCSVSVRVKPVWIKNTLMSMTLNKRSKTTHCEQFTVWPRHLKCSVALPSELNSWNFVVCSITEIEQKIKLHIIFDTWCSIFNDSICWFSSWYSNCRIFSILSVTCEYLCYLAVWSFLASVNLLVDVISHLFPYTFNNVWETESVPTISCWKVFWNVAEMIYWETERITASLFWSVNSRKWWIQHLTVKILILWEYCDFKIIC